MYPHYLAFFFQNFRSNKNNVFFYSKSLENQLQIMSLLSINPQKYNLRYKNMCCMFNHQSPSKKADEHRCMYFLHKEQPFKLSTSLCTLKTVKSFNITKVPFNKQRNDGETQLLIYDSLLYIRQATPWFKPDKHACPLPS